MQVEGADARGGVWSWLRGRRRPSIPISTYSSTRRELAVLELVERGGWVSSASRWPWLVAVAADE